MMDPDEFVAAVRLGGLAPLLRGNRSLYVEGEGLSEDPNDVLVCRMYRRYPLPDNYDWDASWSDLHHCYTVYLCFYKGGVFINEVAGCCLYADDYVEVPAGA